MIRLGKVRRMISSYISEVTGLGGVTQDRMVSPKGLYSNPVNEDAIVIPLLEGSSQDIILAIQKPTSIGVGDVLLTDDKSTIHLKFDGSEIHMKTDTLSIVASKINLNGNVTVNGDVSTTGALTNNGKSVGSTHTHLQMPDGGSGGVNTAPPA